MVVRYARYARAASYHVQVAQLQPWRLRVELWPLPPSSRINARCWLGAEAEQTAIAINARRADANKNRRARRGGAAGPGPSAAQPMEPLECGGGGAGGGDGDESVILAIDDENDDASDSIESDPDSDDATSVVASVAADSTSSSSSSNNSSTSDSDSNSESVASQTPAASVASFGSVDIQADADDGAESQRATRVPAFLCVAVDNGLIKYYATTKSFVAECTWHARCDKCARTRTAVGALRVRADAVGPRAGMGRPIGHLVAWLMDVPMVAARNYHVHEFQPTLLQRQQARDVFAALPSPDVAVMLSMERELRDGEPDEPLAI